MRNDPAKTSEGTSEKIGATIGEQTSDKIGEMTSERISKKSSEKTSEGTSEKIGEKISKKSSESTIRGGRAGLVVVTEVQAKQKTAGESVR